MRSLLIFAALIGFLYSSWGPSWGPSAAIWLLLLGAAGLVGPAFVKANRSERRNHS